MKNTQRIMMRNADACGVGQEEKKGLTKTALIGGIQRRRRLVQKQDRRPEQQRPRHSQTLLLARRQDSAPVRNIVQPMGVSRQIDGFQSLLTGGSIVMVGRRGIAQRLTQRPGWNIAALGQKHGLSDVERDLPRP